MKFKLRHIVFLSFLVLCSFIQPQNKIDKENKTEFSETCLKFSNEFKSEYDHGNILNNKTKKFLSLPEFSKILKTVSMYDLNPKAQYKMEKNTIGKIESVLWINTTKGSKLRSLKRLTFKTTIEQEFNKEKYRNEFTIIDYIITRDVKPKKIHLRIMENEFEEMTIDDVKYSGVFESRLVGIDDAEDEFDDLLNKK